MVLKGHGSMPWAMGQHMWVLYIYIYLVLMGPDMLKVQEF